MESPKFKEIELLDLLCILVPRNQLFPVQCIAPSLTVSVHLTQSWVWHWKWGTFDGMWTGKSVKWNFVLKDYNHTKACVSIDGINGRKQLHSSKLNITIWKEKAQLPDLLILHCELWIWATQPKDRGTSKSTLKYNIQENLLGFRVQILI